MWCMRRSASFVLTGEQWTLNILSATSGKVLRAGLTSLCVKDPYQSVRLSATFGSRFIVLFYITLQHEHLEEENIPLAPLLNEI